MTESNQGPAAPGTAARCGRCGREKTPYEWAYNPDGCYGGDACEIERLKAENASLRANVDQLVGDVQAVAQDYTTAAGALRWIADWDKQPAMMQVARTLHYDMAAKARAALSGEEAAGAAEPPSEVVPEPLPTRASLLESLLAARACIEFDPPSDAAQIIARLRLIVENHNKQCVDFVVQRNSAWRRLVEIGKAKRAAEQRAEAAEKERDEARIGRENWKEACRKTEAERDSNDRYSGYPICATCKQAVIPDDGELCGLCARAVEKRSTELEKALREVCRRMADSSTSPAEDEAFILAALRAAGRGDEEAALAPSAKPPPGSGDTASAARAAPEDPVIKIVAGPDVPWRDVFAAAERELEKESPSPARAALHDEERSAPPQEAGPSCSAVFDEFMCGRTAGHDGKHCDFHTADSPTMWDPIAAAQGEEK